MNISGLKLVRTTGAAALACAVTATSLASLGIVDAEALPNARWRCKMNGDIPLGTLTVSGSSYQFSVARNSAWDEKAGDPGNGSGSFTESGNSITPVSGPLVTVYGVRGEQSPGTDGFPVLFFANKSNGLALFACWRG